MSKWLLVASHPVVLTILAMVAIITGVWAIRISHRNGHSAPLGYLAVLCGIIGIAGVVLIHTVWK